MIKFIVICLLLAIVINAERKTREGEQCFTVDSNRGICRKDIDCPVFREFIKIKNNLRFIKKQFNKCGFSDLNQLLCCPEFEIPEIQTTSIDPFVDTGNGDKEETVENPKPNIKDRVGLFERVCETQCKRYIEELPAKLGQNILAGTQTENGEFGHMAALGYIINGTVVFRCGGSLISENYVLTAAHCLVRNDGILPSIVKLGTILLNDTSGSEMKVDQIIVHPEYERPRTYNDIGLIKLTDKIDITAFIHPACLSLISPRPGLLLSASGWGMTDIHISETSPILLKINLTISDEAECIQQYTDKRNWRRFPDGILTKSQTCAIDKRSDVRGDTCQGDSGGPLQELRDPNGMYTIHGITSLGKVCGQKTPSIYTKVSYFVDWIEKIVWP